MSIKRRLRQSLAGLTIAVLPFGLAANGLQATETARAQEHLNTIQVTDVQLINVKADRDIERHGKRGGPLASLTRIELGNVATTSIAALSGQPEVIIRSALRDQGLQYTLETYDVDPVAFAESLQPRLEQMVRAAETAGRLSSDQATALIARVADSTDSMEKGPRSILRDLTRLQAQSLFSESVSELSGAPLAEVRATLEAEGPKKTVDAYDLKRGELRQAMRPKIAALIEEAEAEGRITADQAESLEERLEDSGEKKRD
ncbi:MAG: hypothetical protein AAFY02_01260 [Pseudomonadota bacterium]